MRPNLVLRIALFALLAPLALLWGELFTRTLLPQSVDTMLDILVPDQELGYIYEPGALVQYRGREYDVPFQVNRFGMRDRDVDPSDDGVFRVLLTGDSFAVSAGESLQHGLDAQLERALQAEMDAIGGTQRVEVINASNGGYTPYHYWKSFRRWDPVFNPELMMVALFTGNDYISEDPDVRFLIEDGLVRARYKEGETPRVNQRSVIFKVRKMLARNSHLYVLMRNYFYYNEKVGQILGRNKGESGVGLEQLQPFLEPEPERVREGWAKTADYLRRLKEECDEAGLPLVVLRVPAKLEVDDPYFDRLTALAEAEGSHLDRDQGGQVVAEICEALDLPVIDPRAAIREEHVDSACYFVHDNHWNRRGTAATVGEIVEELREVRLPPFAP